MSTKTSQLVVLSATLVACLFATGLTDAYALTYIPFAGTYAGGSSTDSYVDDLTGSFVAWGGFSIFDGMVEVYQTPIFIEEESDESDGYFGTQFIISDNEGNLLSFVSQEVSWTEYDGKYANSESKWEIVDGRGKYAGANGVGTDTVWYNLEDMSYTGIIIGNIYLP